MDNIPTRPNPDWVFLNDQDKEVYSRVWPLATARKTSSTGIERDHVVNCPHAGSSYVDVSW